MRRLLPLVLAAACTAPADDVPTDTGDTATVDEGSPPGPGLGNVAWSDRDLWTPIGWIDQDNGVPPPSAEYPITAIKPFGTNSAYMHDGYLITLFAPDSGFGPGGLLVYDVSDPRQPTLVTKVFEPEEAVGRTWDFREAHAMGFSHQDGRKLVALHTGLGVQIWDLNDVHAPERLGDVMLPGVSFGDYADVAWQLAWQGTHLYVAGAEQGVFVVDTEDPANPVLADLGDLANPIPVTELGGFRIGPLFAVGNTLVVSTMDSTAGYAVLDLSDPRRPSLLGTRTNLEKFYATCFGGGRVITSMRGGGARMTIDDVRDPFVFRWENTDLGIDKQLYCATQDEFVFQGGEDEVVKVDISDPTAPQIVGGGVLGRFDTDHGQVTPFGNLVFVGNDHGTGSAFMPHQLEPDTTPPAVSFVSPEDGAQAQGVLTRVGVTFTDNVIVRSVGPETFTVRPQGGQALPGVYTVQGHIVNFEPDEPLDPDTPYELVVPEGGVSDWAGNLTGEAFTSTFRTAAVVGDGTTPLTATVSGAATVEVGQPITFTLDVPDDVQASWRFGEDADWVQRTDGAPVTHAFTEPGHHTVIVVVTDGVRRVSDTAFVTVHRPIPATPPTVSRTLTLGDDTLWAVNHDHGSVTAITLDGLMASAPIPVGSGPRAATLTGEDEVWVSVADDGEIVVIDGTTRTETDRIALHPGSAPAGIVATPDGTTVYVALEALGEVAAFDAQTHDEVARLAVGPRPFGLAVASDGETVWATRKLSPDDGGVVYVMDGDLTTVDTLTVATDTVTEDGEDRARGVPNHLLVPGVSPDEAVMWLPAKQDNILRGGGRDGEPLTHETSVRAVVPRIDLARGAEVPGRRLDLNDRAPPVDVAFSPLGDHAFLALQGSNRVAVFDAYAGTPLGEHRGGGDAVQAVLVSPDGTRLYAHQFLSRTVTVHDLTGTRDGSRFDLPLVGEVRTVPEQDEALSPTVLHGKRIFYDAVDPRMSKDGYISCATCHLDGAEDGRVWDFTDRGEGLRNTIDLRGRAGTGHGPLHWTANFDEVQDFEHDIRGAFGGRGFLDEAHWTHGTVATTLGDPKAGLSEDLDALAAYVGSLDTFPASPHRASDGGLTPAGERGALLFADLACATCHAGADLTDSADAVRHDVGTFEVTSGRRLGARLDGFDAPTLRGLHATAPYLHDGRAATVREVFATFNPGDEHGVTTPLSDDALDDLSAYLLQLD